jgi:hypothetical protein
LSFNLFNRSTEASALIGLGDDAPFALRVAQAIAWCEPRVALASGRAILRSDHLRPRILERDRAAVVRSVLNARCVDAAVRRAEPIRTQADLRGGRLLAYFPDAELADGAAEAETDGLYDVNDAPPWDTWVGLFVDPDPTNNSPVAEYLVSWIPPALIDIAEKGIRVSMVDCIAWLENTKTGVASRLRSDGSRNA